MTVGRIAALTVAVAVLGACGATTGSASVAPTDAAAPAPASTASADGTPGTSGTPGASARVTLGEHDLPTLGPASARDRVPTRVRVARLEIDLPVIAPPSEPGHYPYCDVAEYLPQLSAPGQAGTTFLYAHAREGMFLPILERSRVREGRSMLGLEVEVFTSDDRRFDYEIVEVRRHVTSIEPFLGATAQQLVLQTSEGPRGTVGKTVVIARPTGEGAAERVEAQPSARPIRC